MAFSKIVLLAGASGLSFATPAMAQTAPVQDASPTSPAAEIPPSSEVVVTGSRVARNGDSQPTPVTVALPETLLSTSPSNVADGLNKLPNFANSRGASNLGNGTDSFTGNYLNLRGFGIQRNLVLFDSHRMTPTSFTGAVDINVLPQLLMQRIDVVTGGASAVYGSDAVSGVVNFIVDHKFNGLSLIAQSGVSTRGDAGSYRLGGAAGTDLFGGRGHFEASFERFSQDGIGDKFARASGRAVYAVAGTGTAANPFRLITNARSSAFSFRGNVLSGPLAGQAFVAPGVTGPFVHGTAQGGALESGGEGFYGSNSSLTASLRTNQGFGRFDFALTDDINFNVQGLYADSRTANDFYPQIVFPSLIAPDNAFLSPATQAATGGAPFVFARAFDDQFPEVGIINKTRTYQISTGLDGTIGGFRWNLYYGHGNTRAVNSTVNNQLTGNLLASLDAVDQGRFATGVANGNIVCRVTLTNPGVYPGCVAFNPFGTIPQSQAAAFNYFLATTKNVPVFGLDNIEASVTGTAFDNWAGPVNVAVSGGYRWQSLNVSGVGLASELANCTGIRFNCVQGTTTLYRNGTLVPIDVSERVGEAAVEVDFPLLKDSALARSLSLSGAARYTNYSTSGSVWTWKVGADWEVVDGLRFRATRSRDIRAPSLYDRFQPTAAGTSGFQDIHTGVGGVFPTLSGGNPDLVPEVASVLTVGGVFRPTFAPGLSFAVDYYRMNLRNAISQIDGRLAAIQQVCEASNGTSTFCSLYDRPLPFSDRTPANAPTVVRVISLNAASLKTHGIDGEVNYRIEIGSGNRLTLRGLVGYQPELTTILAPGLPALYGAGAAASQATGGVPKWRLTGFVTFDTPNFAIDVQERWRSSLRQDPNRNNVYAIPDVPSVAYTDVTFTANMGADKRKQFFLSVQNLFDKDPPVYLTAGTSGTPAFSFPAVSGDDVIGRYFTAGVRLKF